MLPQEKEWYEQHGTPEEKQFVAKYGDRKVTAGSFLTSVMVLALMAACFFGVVGSYLYLTRVHNMRPVTGSWVGTMSYRGASTFQRAVYIDTATSLIQGVSPAITGTVRMCDGHGGTQFNLHKSSTGDTATLDIFLASTNGQEDGELIGGLQGSVFHAQYNYNEINPGFQGQLQRGSLQDYERACAALRQ